MDLEKMKAERADALKAIDAIQEAAKVEGRDLTEEQEAKIDELLASAEAKQGEIVKAEARSQRQARLAAFDGDGERQTAPDKIGSRLTDVKELAEDDPQKGFKAPREFLEAVISAGRSGRVDPRLNLLRVEPKATAGSDEQGVYSDPYGGFTVPEGFSPNMLSIGPDGDEISKRVTHIPMAYPVINMVARVDKDHSSSVSGGLTVARRAETDTKSATRMATERIRLEATSLFGMSYCTEELLEQSPISFAALLAAGFKDQFADHLLEERLHGTGVGQYLGVMNSPAIIEIDKETGQSADSIVFENIINMRARVWGYDKAVWCANQDTLPQLMTLNQQIGTAGVPVWQPSGREDAPDILLGRPLVFSEHMKTVGDKGDIGCFNFAEFLEGTYQPLRSAESIHVRFVNHERTFKFWIENAGAPWWRSALTPKNGSTLSPFVTLKARA